MNVAQLLLVLGGALIGLNAFRILLLEALVAWLGAILFGAQVRRYLLRLPKAPYSPAISREALLFGLPLVVNAMAGFLYSRVDVFFIRKYLEATDVADYFLMLTMFQFPLRALNSYIFVLSVDIARAHGARQYQSILKMFYRAEGFGFLAGLGLGALFVAASFVVPWVLPDYHGAALLMRLVAPVLIVKCVAQVASGAFMVSLGRPRAMAGLTVVGGLINVALDVVLIPRFGTAGAVYATLIGHTAMGVAAVLIILTNVRRLAREEPAA
jgi:O-antigen/teichoic acid export membrane protein